MKSENHRRKTSWSICSLVAIGVVAPVGADQPKFEVASVKPSDRCSMQNAIDPGRIALLGDPLQVVLMEAFKVKMDQLIGPSWVDKDCFDIVATMPEGATRDQLPTMLQALLVERFKLVTHKEVRQRPGYTLVIDKNGVKFKESDPSSPSALARAGRVAFGASREIGAIKGSMTMPSLAHFLSLRLDGPVEDLTGLNGKYDIDVSWTLDRTLERLGAFAAAEPKSVPNEGASPPTERGNLFAALRESLGLRLEGRKQQVDVIVIDSIEHVPVGN